jgi:hypothetical protein
MRALLTIALFVFGAAAGGAYWAYTTQRVPAPLSRYEALQAVPEPPIGAELRSALQRRDASSLALLLTQEHQEQLGAALGPVVAISEVRLLEAVRTGNETVVGYIVRGQDSAGADTVAGLVVNLKDNLLESLQ